MSCFECGSELMSCFGFGSESGSEVSGTPHTHTHAHTTTTHSPLPSRHRHRASRQGGMSAAHSAALRDLNLDGDASPVTDRKRSISTDTAGEGGEGKENEENDEDEVGR